MPIPHFIVLGGFLGAGKTSAIRRLGEYLTTQGIRVGLITNDQGHDLVDTQLLRSCGFTTREVVGGCFCCRFDQLMDAASFLTSDVGPEVLVAEAVGSCTDLAATVTSPIRRLFADQFTIAPLNVMVDPIRARRVLGLEPGEHFSDDVEYIYRKQLEEADVIVMNKCDLLPDDSINELGAALSDAYPHADVVAVSTRDGLQLEEWFHRMLYSVQQPRSFVDVDYDVYATGEALLGWVNATITVSGMPSFDGGMVLAELARELQHELRSASAAVAHLKMTLASTTGDASRLASIHLVRNDTEPTVGMSLPDLVDEGRVVVNLRAEAEPELLERALRTAVDRVRPPSGMLTLAIETVEALSPGRPTPTHRDTEVRT
ncbi:MAG: GTP-binding protein [Gemmatimonadaceae bacterium]